MIRKFGEPYFLNLATGMMFLVLLIALTSCGTLDISLDRTPEPSVTEGSPESDTVQSIATDIVTTPTLTQEPASGWGPLIVYTKPVLGYKLLIPESANVQEVEPDENTTYFFEGDIVGESRPYLISVQVMPSEGQSHEKLISTLSTGVSDPSEVQTVRTIDNDRVGTMVTYSNGTGSVCPEMEALMAVFIDRDTGYVIRILSDGQGRCEAANVPEAMTIVRSFQPPAISAALAMTPTPSPEPVDDLVVVFTRDNNAWLWTATDGERQLTKDGGVDQVLLSDDKGVVAFRRGNGIWAVNADGSNERQLVKESDLPIPQEGELADYITGMTINQLAWIPGSRELLFNTRMLSDGPGLLLSDDLWNINADSLFLDYLFLPGDGGNFAIAPDGNRVAVITPDSISLTTINGEDKQRIFGYTPVITYSEFRYYARPVWSPRSDVLGVVIPPPDRLGMENQAFGIWRLHTDGTPAGLVGTIEARGTYPLPEPVINPTLETIAYLSSPDIDPERTDLLFVTWDDRIGDPIFYSSRVDPFYDWSPGGERFSFTRPSGETAAVSIFTGQMDEEPQLVGNGESVALNVRWVDDNSYLYLQASDRGWDLLLNDSSGTDTLIASVGGQPPAFDAVR
ncbi:MAG: hypothetical protein WA996_19855 [Candidatus Promineifilaceae bacterium]